MSCPQRGQRRFPLFYDNNSPGVFPGLIESSHLLKLLRPLSPPIVFQNRQYDIDDIILSEYGTTVVGLEMMRSVNEENAEEVRKKQIVKSAMSTLSASEVEAIKHVFKELDGTEGILVASKIADRVGITRSVIVNALRKFESAGVIESRSSGMKGTYIKVVNEYVFEELSKLDD